MLVKALSASAPPAQRQQGIVLRGVAKSRSLLPGAAQLLKTLVQASVLAQEPGGRNSPDLGLKHRYSCQRTLPGVGLPAPMTSVTTWKR